MYIKEYKDGIAFLHDKYDTEIAFCSNITGRLTFNNDNGYDGFSTIGCTSLPINDVKKIVNIIGDNNYGSEK